MSLYILRTLLLYVFSLILFHSSSFASTINIHMNESKMFEYEGELKAFLFINTLKFYSFILAFQINLCETPLKIAKI